MSQGESWWSQKSIDMKDDYGNDIEGFIPPQLELKFIKEGGLREKMIRARISYRSKK